VFNRTIAYRDKKVVIVFVNFRYAASAGKMAQQRALKLQGSKHSVSNVAGKVTKIRVEGLQIARLQNLARNPRIYSV
jgi:hypothetical protein